MNRRNISLKKSTWCTSDHSDTTYKILVRMFRRKEKKLMWVCKGASRVMIPNIFEKKKTEVNNGFLVARS